MDQVFSLRSQLLRVVLILGLSLVNILHVVVVAGCGFVNQLESVEIDEISPSRPCCTTDDKISVIVKLLVHGEALLVLSIGLIEDTKSDDASFVGELQLDRPLGTLHVPSGPVALFQVVRLWLVHAGTLVNVNIFRPIVEISADERALLSRGIFTSSSGVNKDSQAIEVSFIAEGVLTGVSVLLADDVAQVHDSYGTGRFAGL